MSIWEVGVRLARIGTWKAVAARRGSGLVALRQCSKFSRLGLAWAAALFTLVRASHAADAPVMDAWGQVLGYGFDSRFGRIASPCIQGHTQLRGGRSAVLSHSYNASFDDYFNETQGRLSAGINLLLVGGSARVDYYAKVARTDHSTSYVVKFDAKLGTAVLDQRTLTSVGSATLAGSAEARRLVCGDEYVSEVDLGSSLLIGASFHFSEASDFEQFKYEVKVEALFGLISSTDRWTEETGHFAQDGYLVIDVLQTGGDPAQLAALTGGAGPHVCRFDAIGPCQSALSAALHYARSPTGYAAQFGTPYDPSRLAVLGYRTARYEDSGHDALAAPVLPADLDMRTIVERLSLALGEQQSLSHRADLLLSTVLSPARRQEVLGKQAVALANANGLERALWVCHMASSTADCRAASEQEARERQPLTMSDLQF